MSTIINGTSSAITFPDSSVQNTSAIVSGYVPYANLPAGSVLQVVSTVKSDGFSTTSGSAVDITGLSVTITPKFATSKILITSNIYSGSGVSPYPKFTLVRNGTGIFVGDAAGSATRQSAGANTGAAQTNQTTCATSIYLDSPATTSALTYKWQVFTFSGRFVAINTTQDTSDLNGASVPSTITVMEIAG
jgi:hypothetical protein